MNTTELRDLFRAEMFDAVLPYLVSDVTLYQYIDDAQKQFCRKTEGIEDSRSFTIALASGVDWYDTDPSILKFRSATLQSTGDDVPLVNPEKAALMGVRFDSKLGPTKALVLGLQKNQVRVWPKTTADVADIIELSVFRLPRTVESGDEFEIDEQHHQSLLLWVKHRAYGMQDSELYDRRKSEEMEARFNTYCSESRKEQERARRVVGTVAYGGI